MRLVGLALVGALALWWYSGGMTTATTGTASRDLILARFRDAGMSDALGMAAAINAYAESAWDSSAVGDQGRSVGLFQLNEEGLGAAIALPRQGTTIDPSDPRLDPATNTDVVIAACKADPDIVVWETTRSASVAVLVDLFCRNIENPANVDAEVSRRLNLIPKLFPGVS